MYFLGYDLGNSSVKAALVDAKTLEPVQSIKYPESEMPIDAPHKGWAEQNPEDWWQNIRIATDKLLQESNVKTADVVSIGIAYQMHGLVLVDGRKEVLRPAIIWCDGRAVNSSQEATSSLGEDYCLSHLLNLPGNFTASKLKWVKENEPEVFNRIHKFMLPGDFIAMKMTGDIKTTIGGLSEGVFWDFKSNRIATELTKALGINDQLVPEIVDAIGLQGKLSDVAADELGLRPGIPISYRAGDQPNNAMSLNVLQSGEVAATGGTSGVIYGVTDKPLYDPQSRVNGFAHVNHQTDKSSIGILLCINGAGIQYNWSRKMLDASSVSYESIERDASEIPIGSEGLVCLPFGNGAERIFENQEIGSHFLGMDFNQHGKSHMYRATLEGIAFAFVYGADIMKQMGVKIQKMKVGNDNLFQSSIFAQTVANTLGCTIQVYDTTGAIGVAKASGVGAGYVDNLTTAMSKQKCLKEIDAAIDNAEYKTAYNHWKEKLETQFK